MFRFYGDVFFSSSSPPSHFNTSYVSVLLRTIIIYNRFHTHFNTSYVSVLQYHLHYLLYICIDFNTSYVSVLRIFGIWMFCGLFGFQYIVCFGSTTVLYLPSTKYKNFNTSYVSVLLTYRSTCNNIELNFNTSYVSVLLR